MSIGAMHAAGWLLLHAVWQSAAVAAVVAMCLRWMQTHAAAARYRLAFGGLLTCAILPLPTLVFLLDGAAVGWNAAGGAMESGSSEAAAIAGAAADPLVLAQLADWIMVPAVIVYAGCVFFLMLRVVGGLVHLRRLVGGADAAGPDLIRRVTAEAERQNLGVGAVSVALSTRVAIPIVAGWVEPVVLLPSGYTRQLTRPELDAVLAHEVAHVARRDLAANLIQVAVETLLFFHPAVRWLGSRIRSEREHACDAAVVALGVDRMAYVRTLLRVEQLGQARVGLAPAPGSGLAPAAGGADLLERVQRLTASSEGASPCGRPMRLATAAMALIAIGFGGMLLRPSARALQWADAPLRASVPVVVTATDPAGAFSVAVAGGRVTSVILGDVELPRSRYAQHGEALRIAGEDAGSELAIAIRPDGIRWAPRPPGWR